jgi:hypothetical protein
VPRGAPLLRGLRFFELRGDIRSGVLQPALELLDLHLQVEQRRVLVL